SRSVWQILLAIVHGRDRAFCILTFQGGMGGCALRRSALQSCSLSDKKPVLMRSCARRDQSTARTLDYGHAAMGILVTPRWHRGCSLARRARDVYPESPHLYV